MLIEAWRVDSDHMRANMGHVSMRQWSTPRDPHTGPPTRALWKVDPERGGPMMSQRCAGRAAPSSWNRSSRNSSGTCRPPQQRSGRRGKPALMVTPDRLQVVQHGMSWRAPRL